MHGARKLLGAAAAFVAAASVNAFDMSRSDNAVAYWGQNSIGGSGGTPDQYQKNLGFYCDDDTVDTFLISFLTVYFSMGDMPEIQLANICSNVDNPVFPGTQLPDCSFLEEDIKKCQAKGKIITLSIGGATGGNVFGSDEQAKKFATQVWNLFMGGQSDIRPFGAAVVDAIDLDIEGGSSAGYVAFVEQLRVHYAEDKSKKYYVTAAPQCPFPDAYMGPVLESADIDAVYIQFYNNYCGVSAAGNPQGFNYEQWNEWAETKAPNKNVKLYIGAPGAPGGANAGSYVDATTLVNLAVETREKFPKHFGGVMYWDISQAAANNGFSKTIKDGIRDGSAPPAPTETQAPPSTEAPPPTSTEVPTSPPTEVPPTTSNEPPAPTTTPPPAGGGEVPTTDAPQPTETEDPCPGEEASTSTSVPVPTETEDPCPEETSNEPEVPSSTSSQPEPTAPSTPPSGDCAGAKAWDASSVYTGGQYATLGGKTYKAKWWTQGEQPSAGGSGVWEEASCGAAKRSFNSNHYRTYKRRSA